MSIKYKSNKQGAHHENVVKNFQMDYRNWGENSIKFWKYSSELLHFFCINVWVTERVFDVNMCPIIWTQKNPNSFNVRRTHEIAVDGNLAVCQLIRYKILQKRPQKFASKKALMHFNEGLKFLLP